MLENLQVTILGFSIVMLVMGAITLILMLLPYFIGTAKKKDKNNNYKTEHQEPIEVKTTDNTDNNVELIAVITAAINAYSQNKNKNIRVVSFKRLGDNAPAWNAISRINQGGNI